MKEDEQNVKKNTGKFTHTKTSKKCSQTTDTGQKIQEVKKQKHKKTPQELLVHS